MLAAISFVFGIGLGMVVLAFARRRELGVGGPSPKPTTLGWYTLALGLIAFTAFAIPAWLVSAGNLPDLVLWNVSIAFAFAAVVVGVGTLMRRDIHWPTWAGLIAGLVPAVLWIVFAAGYILGGGG
jgi:hypothetical protein